MFIKFVHFLFSGKTDGSETTSNENHKLFYHLLGTKQSEDIW